MSIEIKQELTVISYNNNPLHLQWVDRRVQNEKEERKKLPNL